MKGFIVVRKGRRFFEGFRPGSERDSTWSRSTVLVQSEMTFSYSYSGLGSKSLSGEKTGSGSALLPSIR